MAPRTIHLVVYRLSTSQRAHFAIFVPRTEGAPDGSLIHVVGAPMAGFSLQFKRGYNPEQTNRPCQKWPIGQVDSSHIHDWPEGARDLIDTNPKGAIEIAAAQVQPPGISQNFMAPVNNTTNKRCQEWTTEYIHHLVSKGYIQPQALQIVQSQRDPPTLGIGLRRVAA